MATTSLVSTLLVIRTGERVDNIVANYIPAYGDLARTNIRSLERGLAITLERRQTLAATVQDGRY